MLVTIYFFDRTSFEYQQKKKIKQEKTKVLLNADLII
jgi:hypothetical protein